jgi:hypothetical protein
MVLSVGGSFVYFARNARFTVTTDLLVWYSNTQKTTSSSGAAIFSLQTLASTSDRNVNYDEKLLTGGGLSYSFYLYRFRKYMPYGFPIINFCNPGVHYETPCMCFKTSVTYRRKPAVLYIWSIAFFVQSFRSPHLKIRAKTPRETKF